MKVIKILRYIISFFLLIALTLFISLSIKSLYSDETVTSISYLDDGAELPVITICIKRFNGLLLNSTIYNKSLPKSKSWTFAEYMEKSYQVKDIIEFATLRNQGDEKKQLSKLELELKQYFDNKTIWQDSFWVYRNRLLPCLTLNHPIKKLAIPDDISINLDFNMTEVKELFIEIHEKGNSLMNQRWNMESLMYVKSDSFYLRNYKAIVDKKIKTAKRPCLDKSFKIAKCYDNFYMSKLNCSFPWNDSYNGSLTKCGSNKFLRDLVKIVNDLSNPESDVMDEIKEFGCTVGLCETTTWNVINEGYKSSSRHHAQLNLEFPSSSKVEVIEEHLAYTGANFMADLGGYTGIFIGASLMTIFNLMIQCILKTRLYISNLKEDLRLKALEE